MSSISDLNLFNQTYYQQQGTTNVPDILATAQPIQEAIRLTIESRIPADPIKVLELGFGTRPDRYLHIARQTKRFWQITLSDFSLNVLPPKHLLPQSAYLNFSYTTLNLLHDPLPQEQFDVILSTYTFDSIDFPDDHFANGHHYPGGLIRIAKKALQHITSRGFFLTIDKVDGINEFETQPAGGAQFKTLDLKTAAKELKLQCPTADTRLITLNDFLASQRQQLPLDLSDHGCLLINP